MNKYIVVVEDFNDGEYFSELIKTAEAKNVGHAIEEVDEWGENLTAVAVYEIVWTLEGGYE
jgi:hypothetical protein